MTPNPAASPQGAVPQSPMPIVALVLAIVGLCFPPLFCVAVVLAIVALARSAQPSYAGRKVLSIVTLALAVVYVPVVGIYAAIAIPNFIKFQARSKQSECKMNLKAAFTAQKMYMLDKNEWATDAKAMSFDPMQGNRYLYVIGDSRIGPTSVDAPTASSLLERAPREVMAKVGPHGTCPDDCDIVMACIGNVDRDDTVDVWTVSTSERTLKGELVPAGVPFNDVNDVTD